MKRIPFLILFLSVQLLSAQQLIHRSIFDVCYSESKQQPLWLEYETECNERGFSRKGLNFKKDTQFTVLLLIMLITTKMYGIRGI